MSAFLKEITKPTDPFYLRLIKGSNVIMPEFTNRGVFYTGTFGFGGVLTSNTTNPLIDVRDYIYTSGTTSNLDFFGYTFDVPTGVKTTDVSFEFNYKTTVSNFTLVVYALCTSGNRQIDVTPTLETGIKLYKRVFTVPYDCTQLKIGWQYTGNASGDVFEYDNIVLRSNGYQVSNLTEQDSISVTGCSTTSGSLGKFPTVIKDGGALIKIDNTGAYTKLIAKRKSSFVISCSTRSGTLLGIFQYNSSGSAIISSGYQSVAATQYAVNSYSVEMSEGDYIAIYYNTTPSEGACQITATASSQNIIQTYQPNPALGELRFLPQNIAPQGFIPAMGSSIGNTTGTYQGASYYELYKVLWTMASVTAGEPYVISSAKGTDAATDWAANKTITIDVSGLVVRAFKSGTTGAVGAKQADAMQGHVHQTPTYGTVGTGYFITSQQVASYAFGNLYSNTPSSDGTNGTPRTASETRMTNVAQYAFIRYGNDAPTLLALPASKENVFSAVISSSGAILSQSSKWIDSVTKNGTGDYTINFSSLGLTAVPSVTSSFFSSTGINDTYGTTSNSTTTARFTYVRNGVATDVGMNIILQKQSPDYTAPGVFVGNVTFKVPTIQKFTSGSGTYITPSQVTYLRVRMVGGGGGGCGSGAGSSGMTSGGVTSFGSSLLTANGGGPGVLDGTYGGSGGSAILNSPAIGSSFSGSSGSSVTRSGTAWISGGAGGTSAFGGAGGGTTNLAGNSGAVNTGSGGGGAGSSGTAVPVGSGGGAGGFIDALIYQPNTSYSYVVGSGGSGGSAGTSGFTGGAGGSGYIEITEYYN